MNLIALPEHHVLALPHVREHRLEVLDAMRCAADIRMHAERENARAFRRLAIHLVERIAHALVRERDNPDNELSNASYRTRDVQ